MEYWTIFPASLARLAIVLAFFHVYSETKSKAILFIGLAFTAFLVASLISALVAAIPLSSEVRAYLSLASSILFTSFFAYGMNWLTKEFRR